MYPRMKSHLHRIQVLSSSSIVPSSCNLLRLSMYRRRARAALILVSNTVCSLRALLMVSVNVPSHCASATVSEISWSWRKYLFHGL